MQIGIFAKTFMRPALGEILDAVRAHGFDVVQFNMACAGLASMPDRIEPGLAEGIRLAAAQRGIRIVAVSGTFNMAHPDPRVRQRGLQRLEVLASMCRRMGTQMITLSTGTRDTEDLWRRHPANDSPAAWADLMATMAGALRIAEVHDVMLAFEPERANVVSSPRRARDLLAAMVSQRLGVIIDPANLFATEEAGHLAQILDEAFELLGSRIVLAHAKDRRQDQQVAPPGQGVVPWAHYLGLLHSVSYQGPLVMHGLEEAQVDAAAAFLRREIVRLG